MTDTPNSVQAGPLACIPVADEPGRFLYLPGAPRLDQPGFTFMSMGEGEGGFLACETVWRATDADLAAAESALRTAYPKLASIDLRIAELDTAQATLTVTPANGEAVEFGPKDSTGAPTYRVVFSESLDAPQAAAVAASQGGEAGRLTLAYRAELHLTETVAAMIEGNLVDRIRTLAPKPPRHPYGWGRHKPPAPVPTPSLEACRAAVTEALAKGELVLRERPGAPALAAVWDELSADLKEAAAQVIRDAVPRYGVDAHGLDRVNFRRTLSKSVTLPFAWHRSADLAGA